MNIRALINREKNKFFDRNVEKRQQRLMVETAELEKEKIRQETLAKINKRKEGLQRDVQKLSDYNKKVAGPTKLQRFGKGLAATINKAKQETAKAKSAGYLKGPNFGSGPGLDFSSGNKSVFDLGKKK